MDAPTNRRSNRPLQNLSKWELFDLAEQDAMPALARKALRELKLRKTSVR